MEWFSYIKNMEWFSYINISYINRTILYILNIVLFFIGIGVIATAASILSKTDEYGLVLENGKFTLPITVLLVGIFMFLLAFLGCCGAKEKDPCMLYTYSSVLLTLVIVQTTCGILLLVYKDSSPDFVKRGISAVFDNYNFNYTQTSEYSQAVNHIQQNLECCGVNGPADWKKALYMDGHSLPDSCCRIMDKNCGKGYFDYHHHLDEIFLVGCYDIIKRELLDLDLGISGLVLAAAGVQLIMVILACVLGVKSKDGPEDEDEDV